jgi:hypothetical protein
MTLLTKENSYGVSSKVLAKAMQFQTRDIVIEAEFISGGDLRISRRRGDGSWSWIIIPQEILTGLLAFASKEGEQ